MPERLECEVLQKVCYINTLTFTLPLPYLYLYLSGSSSTSGCCIAIDGHFLAQCTAIYVVIIIISTSIKLFVVQLKHSGEADYAQVYNLNLRASHLQSIEYLDKVSDDDDDRDYHDNTFCYFMADIAVEILGNFQRIKKQAVISMTSLLWLSKIH